MIRYSELYKQSFIGRIFLTFLILNGFVSLQAQNLVNNWSFEDTVACPTALTQISLADTWSTFGGTPDYFNSCSNPFSFPNVSVPFNQWGYQTPKSGEAYAGFMTRHQLATNSREFIGCELNQSLIPGIKYYLSFYIASAKGPNLSPGLASNKIGVKFSTVPYSSINPVLIDNFAHIYTDVIIIDTVNWTKIEDSFIADSTYQFVSFGNFFDDFNTSFILYDTVQTFAYYYIDDIKLSTDSNFVNNLSAVDSYSNISIFPNPSEDRVFVQVGEYSSIYVYNSLGIEVYSAEIFEGTLLINVSLFKKGIYFFLVCSKNRQYVSKIIII